MSFMVQPAPRIINAPIPNSVSSLKSGKQVAGAAIAILQPQGQNNNHDPKNVGTFIYL